MVISYANLKTRVVSRHLRRRRTSEILLNELLDDFRREDTLIEPSPHMFHCDIP